MAQVCTLSTFPFSHLYFKFIGFNVYSDGNKSLFLISHFQYPPIHENDAFSYTAEKIVYDFQGWLYRIRPFGYMVGFISSLIGFAALFSLRSSSLRT